MEVKKSFEMDVDYPSTAGPIFLLAWNLQHMFLGNDGSLDAEKSSPGSLSSHEAQLDNRMGAASVLVRRWPSSFFLTLPHLSTPSLVGFRMEL